MKKISIAILATIFLLPLGITATELHDACIKGDLQEVEKLINNGADVNAIHYFGNTPLHCAADEGHKDIVKLLIAEGAKMNAKNNIGNTPLYMAASGGHKGIVKLLLNSGAEVNAQNDDCYTPLHSAASGGHEDIVKLLLNSGAEVNATNKYGSTPLHTAVYHSHEGCVRQLTAASLLLKQSNSINSPLSKKALKRLDAHCVGYGDKIFNSFKCLPVPAVEPMQSIICYTLPAKDDIESRYIKSFLKSCYQDLKKNPGQSAFANSFIHEFYKNHLSKLKLYIAIKNNKETAIDQAKAFKKKNIVMYLETIENAQNYDYLDEGLRKQTENNYQQLVKYNG